MIAIHKEFNVFSDNYALKQSYRLLHLVPSDHGERRLFYRFLDQLKNYTPFMREPENPNRIKRR